MDFYQAKPSAFSYGWFSLIWFDPNLSGGSLANVPKRAFFSDLGLGCFRDSWEKDGVGLMFKCGPYGGQALNAYRNGNHFHYINVAHDDPDANMYVIYAKGRFLVDDDRYAAIKLTSSHNTILVDGHGQIGEGSRFTQPVPGDMTGMARITAHQLEGPIGAIEGEAAHAYTGLRRFRRTVLWVENSYILILDDIEADRDRDLTWMVQGKQLRIISDTGSIVRVGSEIDGCDLTVASDGDDHAAILPSTADNHGKSLGFQQLQIKVRSDRWRVAALYDVWDQHPQLVLSDNVAGNAAQVKVDLRGSSDIWTWTPPAGDSSPSHLECMRRGLLVFKLQEH
jgi:Heparinase II/III-like protein